MGIPPANSPVWQRLASGALSRLNTQHLGTQMLIKRLELSPAPVAEKSQEIFAYFSKWERGLGHEINQLARL